MGKSTIATVTALIAALVLGMAGCKEGDLLQGTISPAEASFAEDTVPGGASDHLVTLEQNSVSGGRIVLDVVITEVDEPITGIALKLTYPDGFSKFVECLDGDLFSSGTCYYDEPGSGSGEVFVGRFLIGAGQTVSVDGPRVAVRLEFLVFGEGDGVIRIEAQNLAGGEASAVLDGNGDPVFMQWFSGLLSGT